MGILTDLVGNAAIGAQGVLQKQINADDEEARTKRIAEFTSQVIAIRDRAAMELRVEMADKEREKGSKLINRQLGSNADAALAERYGEPDPNAEPTPDQQAAQAEGLKQMKRQQERERLQYMRNPRNRLQAATEVGLADPATLVQADQRDQVAQARAETDSAKNNTQLQVALARLELNRPGIARHL